MSRFVKNGVIRFSLKRMSVRGEGNRRGRHGRSDTPNPAEFSAGRIASAGIGCFGSIGGPPVRGSASARAPNGSRFAGPAKSSVPTPISLRGRAHPGGLPPSAAAAPAGCRPRIRRRVLPRAVTEPRAFSFLVLRVERLGGAFSLRLPEMQEPRQRPLGGRDRKPLRCIDLPVRIDDRTAPSAQEESFCIRPVQICTVDRHRRSRITARGVSPGSPPRQRRKDSVGPPS